MGGGGRYVPSLLAAIGEVIERHMLDIGFLKAQGELANPADGAEIRVLALTGTGNGPGERRSLGGPFGQCPKCGAPTLIRQEGCDLCTSCGYSKCS